MNKLEIFNNSIKNCTNCDLHKTRTNVVFGEGTTKSGIMFIGEGPGKNEDLQGRPFVGAAGNFLNEMLASIGLNRSDIFIANVVKCRPPNNRDPKDEEIKACIPHLKEQIKIISPRIIVTLGRFALKIFFPNETIGNVHGKILTQGSLKVLALYHPAAALYNGGQRKTLIEDFQIVKNFLN